MSVYTTYLCSVFLLQTMNDISSDMNVQVQPKIGAVPGGGEAKQYFIVCEHKPLFKYLK